MTHPTHTIKETGKELMFVKVPVESLNHVILDLNFFGLGYALNMDLKVDMLSIPLQYDWTLLGLVKELKEEQLEGVMPLIERVYGQSYYDYSVKFKVRYGYTGTALQSLHSLMDMMGLDRNENWVVLTRKI